MAVDLWEFAVAFYERPGIREQCLELQNSDGVDVCLLLVLVWLGASEVRLTPDQIRQLDAVMVEWRTQVIIPLRNVRKFMAGNLRVSSGSNDKDMVAVYDSAKQLELRVEQRAMREAALWLFDAALLMDGCCAADSAEIVRAIESNIRSYADGFPQLSTSSVDRVCATFVSALA